MSPIAPTSQARSVGWAVAILVWCVAASYVAGRIWMHFWDAPTGQVVGHVWYPDPWDDGSRAPFGATGTFVLVAFPLGLITGALAGFLARGREVLTLVAVVAGTCLAAWLMGRYGVHVAPPDPAIAAKTAADGTRMLGTLSVPTWSALAVLPAGAVGVLCGIYLLSGRPTK